MFLIKKNVHILVNIFIPCFCKGFLFFITPGLTIRKYIYKFTALIIRSKEANVLKFIFNPLEKVIHFAIKPIKGGRPAKFAINMIGIHLFVFSFNSSKKFVLFFFISKVTKITDAQYINVNVRKILVLIEIASSIHLKLKMDE